MPDALRTGLAAAAVALAGPFAYTAGTHPGAIVNLHDRGGDPSTPAATCEALPQMITGLRDRGFEIVPLRALLGADA